MLPIRVHIVILIDNNQSILIEKSIDHFKRAGEKERESKKE